MQRFQDNWKTQFNDCMSLYDSLLVDNPEENARFYIMNLMVALYMGYKNPLFETESMYSVVKQTGIRTPQPEIVLSDESKSILTYLANTYDWTEITPMFVATVGENMLESKERRKQGAHYTSIENIHKLIGPLFLDELTEQVEEVEKNKDVGAAKALQETLSDLKFLDPACGGGNFLIETYLCLRELENRLIKIIYGGKQ